MAKFVIRSLTLGEILDQGFHLFTASFFRIAPFQVVAYLPPTLLLWFGEESIVRFVRDAVSLGRAEDPLLLLEMVPRALFAFALMIGVSLLSTAVGSLASVRGLSRTYLGQNWDLLSLLPELGPRLIPSIAAWFLMTAIHMLAFGLPIAVFIGVALVAVSGQMGWAVGLFLLLLGSLAFLVALVAVGYLSLRFSFVVQLVALEDRWPLAALRRSAILMQGRYIRGLALIAILFMVGMIPGTIAGAFVPTPAFEAMDPDQIATMIEALMRAQVLSATIQQIVAGLIGIFSYAVWVVFFYSTLCEAEGFDLEYDAKKL